MWGRDAGYQSGPKINRSLDNNSLLFCFFNAFNFEIILDYRRDTEIVQRVPADPTRSVS